MFLPPLQAGARLMDAASADRGEVAAKGLRVSVIVPHYNDLAGLGRCLDALDRQTLSPDAFEIVVADNASPQGEAAVAAVISGRAKLVIVAERGAGPTRNGGVAASIAPLLAFTDSDCLPAPAWLAEGMAALDAHDVAGGRMTVEVDPSRPKSGAEAFEQLFAFDNARYIRQAHFTVSANLFCPRAVFDKVGGFRTHVSEDIDWCHRARAMGYTLGYTPQAVVGHPARADWAELLRKWRRINAEQYALAIDAPGGRLRWLARAWMLPASVLVHAPRALRSPRLSGWRERGAALGTLARLRLWRLVDAHRLLLKGR